MTGDSGLLFWATLYIYMQYTYIWDVYAVLEKAMWENKCVKSI